MTTCQDAPLATSVDIDACEMPHPIPVCADCCTRMATLFSPFCGGCTGLACGYMVASAYFSLHYALVEQRFVSAGCMALNVIVQLGQSNEKTHHLQLLQAVLCVLAVAFSAHCYTCAAMHWLVMLAFVVHLGTALAIVEMLRLGDCRRCMNEAHKCECGSLKDPVPPGSLAYLVGAIEARWIPLSQRTTTDSHAQSDDL